MSGKQFTISIFKATVKQGRTDIARNLVYNDFSSSAKTGMVRTVNMDPSDFVAVHDVEKLPHRVQEGRRQPREGRRFHFHCRESRGHLTPLL